MSINWDCGETTAHKDAHKAACVSGEFDYTVPTWDIFTDLREALIWGLIAVGFPTKSGWQITEKNWKEIFKRLHILEATTGCRRIYNNGKHVSRKVYFTPPEIKSMIGMKVNAGNKSDTVFKTFIYKQLEEDAEGVLFRGRRTDPYYYEKLFAPKEAA